MLIGQVTAQTHTISGTVSDANGAPVMGASVSLKGSNRGTSTDNNGSFVLTVPDDAGTLVISAVNFAPLEVGIHGKTTIGTVALQPAGKSLGEVVVVAYGTQHQTNVTGAVTTVNGNVLADRPFTSVDKALQGAVPGMWVSSASGAPGAATDIVIRGIGSINANSSPLWVIDGAIVTTTDLTVNTTTANPLSAMNPDDIDNISVLRDAASTAPYGSRAGNGVVLVTTKKGRAGLTHISVTGEFGQNSRAYTPGNVPENSQQLQTTLRQDIINGGIASGNAGADQFITQYLGYPANYAAIHTNWFDVASQKGGQSQVTLSLSGGNDKTTIYASAGYFDQQGVSIASDFQRFTGALAVTHKASDRFRLSANINGSNTSQHTPPNGGFFANPVLASYFLLPWFTPRLANGQYRWGSNDSLNEFPLGASVYNPLVTAAWNNNQAQQTALRGSATGELKILDHLNLTSRFAGEYLAVQEDQYLNPFYGDGYESGGVASSNYSRVFDYTWSNFADWQQKIDREGDAYFDVKAGIEAYDFKLYSLSAGGKGFPQTLDLKYVASAANPTQAYALPTEQTTFSYFGIGDLNYKDRYVLSGSIRRDESSVFGADHRWGTFYSVGGSWNITEEAFMKKQKIVDLLKLRASYGQTGNTNGFGFYTALPTYGSNNYSGQAGLVPSNVGDSGLTWEKNQAIDIGLDLAVLKDRIDGTVEYYHRTTNDLLSPIPYSYTTGFASQNENVGSVVNKGFEVVINARPVVRPGFSWVVQLNIAHNTNRVTALYKGTSIPSQPFQLTVGHDLQEYYLPIWAGVNTQTGQPQWYTDGSKKTLTADNDYNSAGYAFDHRSAAPTVFGGLDNTFTLGPWGLDLQLDYTLGNYIFDPFYGYLNSDGYYTGAYNQLSQQLQAWQKAGDKTDVPQIVPGRANPAFLPSTRWLYKGNYVRLRNFEFSYNFTQDVLRRLRISRLSLYIRGTNLATWGVDKHLPYDPEAGLNSQANLEVVIPRTIAGGIKIGF